MKTLILFFFLSASACAGTVVGATRVIFDATKNEAQVSVANTSTQDPYLIQSWVDNYNDKNSEPSPFVILPPLFRLDSSAENAVRIVSISNSLPTDKESIFWLNIKAIPASNKNAQNQLLISIKTKIKLIWRPKGLSKEDANSAYKKVSFRRLGSKLQISNPTPYYISFQKIAIDNIELKNFDLIAPKSSVSLDAPAGKIVRWEAINDFGAITQEMNFKF